MGGGGGGGDLGPRPMTSNKGAGYSSSGPKPGGGVMGNIGSIGMSKGPAPPLLKKAGPPAHSSISTFQLQTSALSLWD